VLPALRPRLQNRGFAEVVALAGRCQRRVGIRRAYESVLVRIRSNVAFNLQATLQRRARIASWKVGFRGSRLTGQIGLVPGAVVGELVFR